MSFEVLDVSREAVLAFTELFEDMDGAGEASRDCLLERARMCVEM